MWLAEGGLADQVAERSGKSRQEVLESTHAKSLTGRMGREDEVAAAIVFLCSEQASNVVGAAWSVDGGATQAIF
jgi:NAD(P)-dependent dehydrogenase (short-subunit alcohol dehydrogenase family)